MGLFQQVALFPGGKEPRCRLILRELAQEAGPQLGLRPDDCRWYSYDAGAAVLLNDGCAGYEDLAQALSDQLPWPVMLLYIYDGDFWGYEFYQWGKTLDAFATLPGYFSPGQPPDKRGDASCVAKFFGVEKAAIERYLIPWPEGLADTDEDTVYAYERDFYGLEDPWQMWDLMKALGFNYDLLNPQPEASHAPPHQTVPVTPTAPPVTNLLPDFEEVPDALTDRDCALLRAGEVEEMAPEAARLVREEAYQQAVPLLTDALRSHPDKAGLYILRAFCWNQLESQLSGMSRKPDMDRDLTKALSLEPDNILILRARCPIYGSTTRYQRHIQDLTRLLELDPDHWDNYLTKRAYRYHWVGDDDSARADLKELVQRGAPPNVDLNYLLRELGMG